MLFGLVVLPGGALDPTKPQVVGLLFVGLPTTLGLAISLLAGRSSSW